MNRLAHVDGLRAVAVLAVLLYHLGFATFSGGFVGVDVFFVISGFVITRMIVRDVQLRRFSFAGFYVGRMKRLIPALLVVVLASGLIAFLIMTPQHLEEFSGSAIASMLAWSNVYFWQQAGYFDTDALMKPLLHTWTLSVEWQFYAIWPLLLTLTLATGRRWFAPVVIVVAAIASLAANIVWQTDPTTIFYWMPFRIFEFAVGALLVWTPNATSRPLREALFVIGLVLIAYAVFTYDAQTLFPSLNALPPVIGAALAIYAGGSTSAGKLIDNPVAAWLGRTSYSTYLVHWPLIVFWGYLFFRPLSTQEAVLLGFVSIGLGAALHYAVEMPFWKGRVAGVRAVPAGIAAATILMIAPAMSAMATGWPWRVDPDSLAMAADPAQFHKEAFGGAGFDTNRPIDLGKGPHRLVIAGDSHALHFASGLDSALADRGIGAVGLFDHGCFIAPNLTRYGTSSNDSTGCFDEYQKLQQVTAGNDLPLVLAYSWNSYRSILTDKPGGEALKFSSESEYFEFLLRKLDEINADVGKGRHVVLIGTVPGSGPLRSAADCVLRPPLAKSICSAQLDVPVEKANGYRFNKRLEQYAADHGMTYVDPYSIFCSNGSCQAISDGRLLYSDAGHLSKDGSLYAADRILGQTLPNLVSQADAK